MEIERECVARHFFLPDAAAAAAVAFDGRKDRRTDGQTEGKADI